MDLIFTAHQFYDLLLRPLPTLQKSKIKVRLGNVLNITQQLAESHSFIGSGERPPTCTCPFPTPHFCVMGCTQTAFFFFFQQ